jgi:hypothetical protein
MNDQMQRKMKPSEVGYFGKGVPDPETMSALQSAYSASLLANGYVAPEVRDKLKLMQELHAKALSGKEVDEDALRQGMTLATELLPILNFKVDDVDWDMS